MNFYFILFVMIFCHIVDDYYLQGILASMKQKAWWRVDIFSSKYRYDYIVALIMHAFSWSFMIMIPYILIGANQYTVIIAIAINTTIHAIIDDLKANKKKITLITDQTIHLLQIVATWLAVGFLGF